MKKILLMLALTGAVVSTGLSQGTVSFAAGSTASTRISTNAVVGGGATGTTFANASTVATTYYYALFYSATEDGVGGVGGAFTNSVLGAAGEYAFQDSNWSFMNTNSSTVGSNVGTLGLNAGYATNGSAGRLSGYIDPNANAYVTSSDAAQYMVLIGWSANIGSTVAQLMAWYNAGSPSTVGWVGESAVGLITPANPNASPTPGTPGPLFGSTGTSGVLNPFVLGETPVPEPATIALAGLGGLSMLLKETRKIKGE